jgi:glucose-6-phosphate dehydrogenase assembly protein OpcA
MSPSTATAQRHEHASGLHALSSELAELHRDAVRESSAASTHVRHSVVNVIAACIDPALAAHAAEVVLQVAARHPARAIVIVANARSEPLIESDISLHETDGGGQYIELVRLTVGGEPAAHLASIVMPLVIPDIPVHLWLVGAPPLEQAFRAEVVAACDSVILDTGAYADVHGTLRVVAAELDEYRDELALSDVAWERTRLWREAVAGAFIGPSVRPWLQRISGIDVVSFGSGVSTDAWLIAGWLTARLSRTGRGGAPVGLSSVPSAGAPPGELAAVRVRCGDARHTARVFVERRGQSLRTVIDIDGGVVATGSSMQPGWNEASLIARLMSDATFDPLYHEAIREAARLSGDETE